MKPDAIRQAVQALTPEIEEIRHAIHRNPELGEQEKETAALVEKRLRALGLAPQTGVGGHGVVATLEGARPGPTLALRADMDALPIQEENDRPYCSRNLGVMHACGHDGHTAILLGAASILAAQRDEFAGRVRFLFQPAEETVNGAARMCEDGCMEGVDAIIGLHGWAGVGVGQIGIRSGPMMASTDTFDITVIGRGAHAAYPHLAIDPILVASEIVLALQSLASREVDPADPVVVTVSRIQAGTAYNIIPATAYIAGTVRTLSAALRATMPERIRRVAEGICAGHRATCDFSYTQGAPPVVNDSDVVDLIARVGADVLGAQNVLEVAHPSMGAEDFAYYLEHAPGAMFRLGLGNTPALHTANFDFEDRALPVGVEMFSRLALEYLV